MIFDTGGLTFLNGEALRKEGEILKGCIAFNKAGENHTVCYAKVMGGQKDAGDAKTS
jgi:hypothetical protein